MEKWATMSWTITSVTTKNNWEISYMNVKTTFLNRESKDDVFTQQLKGYSHPIFKVMWIKVGP
jgi:hypothetical protein